MEGTKRHSSIRLISSFPFFKYGLYTCSWTEAMQLMKEGGKWELYIKSELGYGDRGAGALIPGGSVLIFELELLEVQGDFVK
jgi:FKBP-type peptidyl-prolyl cis-trans isomerase